MLSRLLRPSSSAWHVSLLSDGLARSDLTVREPTKESSCSYHGTSTAWSNPATTRAGQLWTAPTNAHASLNPTLTAGGHYQLTHSGPEHFSHLPVRGGCGGRPSAGLPCAAPPPPGRALAHRRRSCGRGAGGVHRGPGGTDRRHAGQGGWARRLRQFGRSQQRRVGCPLCTL